eukprot:g20843.t1
MDVGRPTCILGMHLCGRLSLQAIAAFQEIRLVRSLVLTPCCLPHVDLVTEGGITVTAAVPSGASTGVHEACELRDGDKGRYLGKGVMKAVESVNTVLNASLKGFDVSKQKEKTRHERNRARGVPLYQHFADLAGNGAKLTLPVPCFNVINGGSHAGNKLAFQEYFIIPVGASSFKDAMRIGAECYHTLKGIIKKKFGGDATLIGDEGGFAPPCDARQGDKCKVGMDVAASEFKVEGVDCYDLGTCTFTTKVGGPTQVVGDDLTVTNVSRVQKAITDKACNALLLKVNQSLALSIDAVKLCKTNGWGVMCSHRSGETEDTTIADLAVGLCTGQIKTGAPCRSDRNASWNRKDGKDEERRARNERRNLRRLLEIQPLPAKLPEKGDPEEVNILVIGDWGTYPGTGINMGTDWDVTTWNSVCFYGSSSPKAWKEQKVTTGEEDGKTLGMGSCEDPDSSFVINTADNFYYYGVTSTKDKMWSMMFEEWSDEHRVRPAPWGVEPRSFFGQQHGPSSVLHGGPWMFKTHSSLVTMNCVLEVSSSSSKAQKDTPLTPLLGSMGDETKKGLTVLVCGGGNAAQVATAMFAARYETYAISLYADEAAKWKKHMMGARWHDKVEGMELTLDTGRKLISTPTDISNDPSLAGKADVIILAVPSFAHGQYFEAFYPYIKAGTIVACMPARSGGDILFASKMKEKADSLAFVGFETLPWACRFTEWGKRATILGTKGQILAAVTPESEATRAIATLQGLLSVFPAVEKSPNNLGISLRNPGQEKWDGKPLAEKPLFYQGVDDFTEKVLLGLSDEVQDVCRKVEALVPGFNLKDACTLHRWYLDSYKGQMADDSTLKLSMNTNSAYVGLTHPMNPVEGGFMPDLKYRYLAEDVPTGLCFTRGLAELLEVPTPTIDKVISFAQESLGKSFLVDGKMTGNHDYGGHTCDVCLFKTDGKDTRRDRPCSQAMIDYDTEHDWQWPSDKEVRWVMPMKGEDRWYMKSFNFKKANVTLDVFVIDTNKAHISSQCRGGGGCPGQAREKCISFFMRLWTRQREWLLPALESVYHHIDIICLDLEGRSASQPDHAEESLMEEMRDRGVSVYMAGHVHQLRHDQHPSGIEVIISGSVGGYQSAGGGTAYTLHESMDARKGEKSSGLDYGFAAINVKPTQLTVEYWNDQGQRLWDPIIVPAKDLVKEGLLKKLRTAALQSDDGIAKAKEYGVEERLIFAAAIAGIKAFEAEGGLAWVYLQPKIMKTGAARTSAMLASWTTEDSLPGTATQLVLPDKCCSSSGQSFESTQSVLCYASKEQCSGEQMAFNMAKRGAGAMLWASKRQLLANETSNPDLAEAFNLPAASIPESFVKDIPSWLGNKDEVIFISYTGGKKGFDDAVEHARTLMTRSAGVPEELINAAIQNGARRRAKEHVQTAAKNENQTEIKEALDEAQEVQAEGDIINEAKRKLEILQLEECKDFDSVHDVIQRAEAFEILNTTLMNSAEGCRLQLAVDALDAAVKSGTQCKERLEVAVAWCRLAHAPEAVIESAEIDCEAKVKAKTHHSALLVVVVLILAAGAGVFLWLCSKSQQATAPTTRSNPGGIELLETDAS